MEALDRLLLDRLFQPIVNRLLKSPSDLAMNMAVGALVMAITPNIYWLLQRSQFWPFHVFIIIENLVTFGMCWGTIVLTRTIIKPGYRNPLRDVLRTTRIILINVVVLTISVGSYFSYVIGFLDMAIVMVIIANPLWMSAFYFVSCDYPPPKPARDFGIRTVQPSPVM